MNFNRKNYTDDTLITLYKALLLPRVIEEKMLVLLRQGKISKWFSAYGQEAISVGTVLAVEGDEWLLPAHRNFSHNGKAKTQDLPKAETALFTLGVKNIIS